MIQYLTDPKTLLSAADADIKEIIMSLMVVDSDWHTLACRKEETWGIPTRTLNQDESIISGIRHMGRTLGMEITQVYTIITISDKHSSRVKGIVRYINITALFPGLSYLGDQIITSIPRSMLSMYPEMNYARNYINYLITSRKLFVRELSVLEQPLPIELIREADDALVPDDEVLQREPEDIPVVPNRPMELDPTVPIR